LNFEIPGKIRFQLVEFAVRKTHTTRKANGAQMECRNRIVYFTLIFLEDQNAANSSLVEENTAQVHNVSFGK
jgi:hypothetical protein